MAQDNTPTSPSDQTRRNISDSETESPQLDPAQEMDELAALEAAAAKRRRSQELSAHVANEKQSAHTTQKESNESLRSGFTKLSQIEKLSLAGCIGVVVIAGAVFLKYLHAYPAPSQSNQIASEFALPLQGQLATLSAVETFWRHRVDEDNAPTHEKVLPVAKLSLGSGSGSNGFVRVEFLDSERKIRGDIAVLTIEGGKFKDTGRGEKISADGLSAEVASTVGFPSETLFGSYLIEDEPRWVLRLREGSDYSDGPWTILGMAEMANDKR